MPRTGDRLEVSGAACNLVVGQLEDAVVDRNAFSNGIS